MSIVVSALCGSAFGQALLTPGVDGEYFHPETVAYARYDSGGWQVSARRSPLAVEVTSGAIHHVFRVAREVEQLRDARVVDGKLVVVGWMNSSRAADVSIYSLQDEVLIDEFWGYWVAPSPDSKSIAFVQFYPAHGASDVTDVVRIYKVSDDRRANRFDEYGHPGSSNSSEKFRVGEALFPAGSDANGNVDVGPKLAYRVMSYLTWDDSGQLVFVTRNNNRIELQRIDADARVHTTSVGQQCEKSDHRNATLCVDLNDFFRIDFDAGNVKLTDDERRLRPMEFSRGAEIQAR